MDYLQRWSEAWLTAGLDQPPAGLVDELLRGYGEPNRKYHSMQHLKECLEGLTLVADLAERPSEIEIALWFHDAIYDTARHDNEERCADWARSTICKAGGEPAVAGRVYDLIMATRHSVPSAGDAGILVDIDLKILGAEPERFREYEQQIREEYKWVPLHIFREKRLAVLQTFLRRKRIFNTNRLYNLCEIRARANLLDSIGQFA